MFILASASASRQHILSSLGYRFSVHPSNIDEFFDSNISAEENAKTLAKKKAIAVSKQFPNTPVIGVDTIQIDPDGKWLEKPKDETNARHMMQNRSGKEETIISGIALVYNNQVYEGYDTTKLFWKSFTLAEIDHVIQTGEWQGKCGGIAIEGVSGLLLEKIEGNIANVMGFPINIFWEWQKIFPNFFYQNTL